MTSLVWTPKVYQTGAKRVSGFDPSQAVALSAVMISRIGNRVRLGEAMELLDLALSSLVRMMDQLIEAVLLKRVADENDRRAKILTLTDKNLQKADLIEQVFSPFRREWLKNVSEEDIDVCLRVFDGLKMAFRNCEDI